jgi:F0F1-type ATP synthase membrane subunit b/b'
MNINITLIVQFINFLVTYLFLNRFLFQPIILRLRTKKECEEGLLHDIATEEELMIAQQKAYHKQLLTFQQQVRTAHPTIHKKEVARPRDIIYQRNKAEVDILVAESTEIIVKRVIHVD